MNILIVGSGRVGSKLASMLDAEGHQVSIIDGSGNNFDTFPDTFKGFTRIGIPIDQDVLKYANIENCDALAALSPNDNTNIMVSQLATEIFNVPNVLARISDPRREDVFSHFGLKTICPTNLAVASAHSALTESEEPQTVHLGTKTLSFVCKSITKDQIGVLVKDYKLKEDQHIYGILKPSNSIKLYHEQKNKILEKGDKVVITTTID